MSNHKKIIENFSLYFKYYAEKVTGWIEGEDEYQMIFRLSDGGYYIYDDLQKSGQYISEEKWDNSHLEMSENEWKNNFGRRLSRILQKYGLSQRELSDFLNISETTVSKYINGETIPSAYTLYRISRSLDLDPEKLMFFERQRLGRFNPINLNK